MLLIVSATRYPDGVISDRGRGDALEVAFEIWNRRKNPIVEREISGDFGTLKDRFVAFDKDEPDYPDVSGIPVLSTVCGTLTQLNRHYRLDWPGLSNLMEP
jgi:hypothetical protein